MKMKDRHEPATKGDIAELRRAVQEDLKGLREEVQEDLMAMRRENVAFHKELMHQLGVIEETICEKVLGASNDRIESLKDSRDDHERRIRRLEKSSGLVAA